MPKPLSTSDEEFYKKLLVKSPEAAGRFLKSAGADAAVEASDVEPEEPLEEAPLTGDEVFVSGGFLTERERLAAGEGEIPDVEPQELFRVAKPEDVINKTPLLAYTPDGGFTQDERRLSKFKSTLRADEVGAFNAFKKQLIEGGASYEEAEAQASQLVSGIILAPRDVADFQTASKTAAIDKSAYASGESGFLDASSRQELETASQMRIKATRKERGALNLELLNEQVNRDLAAYQTQGDFFVKMRADGGGIDPDKVKAWKDIRLHTLTIEGKQRVESTAFQLLMDDAKSKGEYITPGSDRFAELQDMSRVFGDMWHEEVDPEYTIIQKPRDTSMLAAEDSIFTAVDPEGKLVESRTGAAMRTVGGLIRFVTDPLIASLTYDTVTDEKTGRQVPVNPEDTNYIIASEYDKAIEDIASGKGGVYDYAQKYNPFALVLTGRREPGSGVTKVPELTSGNYLNDVAFAMAVGRSVGDDFADLPAARQLYGDDSWIPFIAGLGVEIALPLSPTTAVGAALKGVPAFGKTFGLAPALARLPKLDKLAKGVARVGEAVDSPVRRGLSPLVSETLQLQEMSRMARSAGIEKPSYVKSFSGTQSAAEYAANVMAPKVADILRGEAPIPSGLNDIRLKVQSADVLLEATLTGSKAIPVTPLSRIINDAVADLARGGITDPKEIQTAVINVIVRDDLLEKLAKTDFNTWQFISPTMVVKTAAWEKDGKAVDAAVRSTIWGTDDIAKIEAASSEMLAESGKLALAKPGEIADLIVAELGRPFVGSSTFWNGLVEGLRANKALSIADFSDVVDVVRTHTARQILGRTATLEPRAGSVLTEASAVPVARRLPLARLVKDTARLVANVIPDNDIGKALVLLKNRILNTLAPSIPDITKGSSAPLPMINAVQRANVQINRLADELIEEFQNVISSGTSGSKHLNELVAAELFAATTDIPVFAKQLKRFFDTTDAVISKFAEEGGLISKVLASNPDASRIDQLIKLIAAVRKETPMLAGKGLKDVVGDSVAQMLLAEVLDARMAKVVKQMTADLAARYPTLFISLTETEINVLKGKYTATADASKKAFGQGLKNIITNSRLFATTPTTGGGPALLETVVRGSSKQLIDASIDVKLKERIFNADLQVLVSTFYEKIFTSILKRGAADFDGIYTDIRKLAKENVDVVMRDPQTLSQILSDMQARLDKVKDLIIGEEGGAVLVDRIDRIEGQLLDPEYAKQYLSAKTMGLLEADLQLLPSDIIAKLHALGIEIPVVSKGYDGLDFAIKEIDGMRLFLDGDTQKLFDALVKSDRFITESVEGLSALNKGAGEYALLQMKTFFETIRRNIYSGVLGGVYTLNSRFLGVNNISAPLIVSVTAPGFVGAAIAAVPGSFVRPFARASQASMGPLQATVGGAIAGGLIGGLPGAIVGGTYFGVLSDAFKSSDAYRGVADWMVTPTLKNVVVSESGKVFDKASIREVMSQQMFSLSEQQFNFSNSVMGDLMRSAEVNSRGKPAFITEQLRRSIGPFTKNTSLYAHIGTEADFAFREAVFVEALRRGHTEAEAGTLARNALLDYSNLSKFEKDWITPWYMFYTFQRQMTAEIIMSILRDGANTNVIKQALVMQRVEKEFLRRDGILAPKDSAGRPFADFSGAGQSYDDYHTTFYGPSIPSVGTALNVYGALASAVDGFAKGRFLDKVAAGTWEKIISRPELAYLEAMSEIVSPYEDAAHGKMPSNVLINMTELGIADWAVDRYGLVPVKIADNADRSAVLAGRATWAGTEWKFQNETGRALFIADQFAAQALGFQRSLNDWSSIAAKAAGVDPEGAQLKKAKDGNWALFAVGLQTPMYAPSYLQAQGKAMEAISRDLNLLKRGKLDVSAMPEAPRGDVQRADQ